jgi:acyl carrier protein
MDKDILAIVLDGIKSIGEMEDNPVLLNPSENLRLFGSDGVMDSMGIVMLITEIEEKIEDDLGKSITLADDRAMSQKTSPFRSVKTLVRYIQNLLKDQE